MGKIADLTVVQNTAINKGKPQKVIVKEADCSDFCVLVCSQKVEWKNNV